MQEDLQRRIYVFELLKLLLLDESLKDFRDVFATFDDLEEFANRAAFALYDAGRQVIKQGERGDSFLLS